MTELFCMFDEVSENFDVEVQNHSLPSGFQKLYRARNTSLNDREMISNFMPLGDIQASTLWTIYYTEPRIKIEDASKRRTLYFNIYKSGLEASRFSSCLERPSRILINHGVLCLSVGACQHEMLKRNR